LIIAWAKRGLWLTLPTVPYMQLFEMKMESQETKYPMLRDPLED
jgi:hypothetical protein